MMDQYQVITLDLRNHGLSPHGDDFNYKWMSEDVLETLSDLGLDKVYLLGHSMGGKAAGYIALKHPHRIKKLVIIDIAPKSYPPHHTLYFKVMRSMDFGVITNRIQADQWMQKDIPEVAIRQFLLKNLVRDDQGRFKWRFNLEALYQHYDEINVPLIAETPYHEPTLFIRGALSNYITGSDETLIHALFTNAEITTIEDAGHWVHADQPDKLKKAVVDFLKFSSI